MSHLDPRTDRKNATLSLGSYITKAKTIEKDA